mgnify:CR=1 FL=1
MDCLNSGEKKNATNYQNFDIENLQADQQTPRAGASQQHSSSSSGGSKRRCCSIPALLGIAALLFSIVALILSIYATVAAKKVGGTSVNGMFLTTDPQSVPQGWKAVNLFKASTAGINLCSVPAYIVGMYPDQRNMAACHLILSLKMPLDWSATVLYRTHVFSMHGCIMQINTPKD